MAINNIDISTNERLQLNENSINSGTINTKFGRPEDFIELHIYNQNDQLLTSDYNFTQYKFPEETTENLASELNMDPVNVLRTKGYTTGKYKLVFNIQRLKIFNTTNDLQNFTPFSIKEISSTRRELKLITPKINNIALDTAASLFIREIEAAPYLRDFVLNFNDDINVVGVNLSLNGNSSKSELLIKLIDPLPSNINTLDTCRIVEEITDPIILNVDLGLESTEDEGIPLQGPNFKIDVRLNNSVPSSFKNYDEILDYSLTSSYHNLLNHLENREIPDISYDFIRTVSGSNEGDPLEEAYHFENFTNFSSAVERLKNFEYKIQLIELYDSQTSDINSITGPTATAPYVLENKEEINKKKQNLIKGFDGYERFLYYTSGTFAWPKQNSTPPYTLHPLTSSIVKEWLGSEIDTSPNYGGQLLSASQFDKQNENALTRLVPNHIMDNPNNSFYTSFVNMVGQHFDQIWVHIKHLTEVNDAHHTRGISKELVYFSLKSLGLETFDQFENSNLIEYILGEGTSGSVFYDTPQSQSLVTASMGSIPKSDITKNIWKRLYHNAPYLLKTKGTERGLRALMSCYGIPSTILNVKEYGGSTSDKTTYKTFTNDKSGLALKGDSNVNGYFIKVPWFSNQTHALSSSAKTVEFRIKPHRSDENYHLWSISGSHPSADPNLTLEPYNGPDISSSGDSNQYGKLKFTIPGAYGTTVVTDNFPVYNGDFWNIFIGTDPVADGVTDNVNDLVTVHFGAYQSNHLKTINHVTSSFKELTWVTVATSWGLKQPTGNMFYISGSNLNNEGVQSYCYIGGVEPNNDLENEIDGLRYSGSLQEVRFYFGELLSHETLKKHALEPFMYAGNTISSSYESLVLRLPLGSNDKRDTSSYHPNDSVNYILPYNNKLPNVQSGDGNISTTLEGISSAGTLHNSVDGDLATSVTFNGSGNGAQFNKTITYLLSSMFGQKPHIINKISLRFNENENLGHKQVEILGSNDDTTFTSIAIETLQENYISERDFSFNNHIPYNTYQLKFNEQGFPSNGQFLQIKEVQFFGAPEDTSITNMVTQTFEEVVEEHYTPTPDTVGISTTSEKTRIDIGTIDDDWLSPTRKTETSTLDNQPPDYEDLGVFFSPTNEINEDIIYTLGAFRLDDYIGSPLPNQQTASKYEDLATIKNIYFKKVKHRYNYWDYIKLIQYIDHTLFKLVEQWVPMKANLKTGLLIEPHYLERTKFARELPVIDDDQTMIEGSYNTINSEIEPNRSFSLTGSSVIVTNNLTELIKIRSSSYNEKELILKPNNFTITGVDSIGPDGGSLPTLNPYTFTNLNNIIDTGTNNTTIIDALDNDVSDNALTNIVYTFSNPQYLSKVTVNWTDDSGVPANIFFYGIDNNVISGSGVNNSIGNIDTSNGDQSVTYDQLTLKNPQLVKYFIIDVTDNAFEQQDPDYIGIDYIKAFIVDPNDISKEKIEQGTNVTIDIDDYILDEPQEASQAPITPYSGSQPAGYKKYKSSTLLGNATKGKTSRRYYRKRSAGTNKETEY